MKLQPFEQCSQSVFASSGRAKEFGWRSRVPFLLDSRVRIHVCCSYAVRVIDNVRPFDYQSTPPLKDVTDLLCLLPLSELPLGQLGAQDALPAFVPPCVVAHHNRATPRIPR